MNTLYVDNVNGALLTAIGWFKDGVVETREIEVRGSVVLEALEPFTTVYANPRNRVLMIPERDANPFFHLFESLWILAGRKDVAWLSQFNSNIANYSDDGEWFHAAYGRRLRHTYCVDQIEEVIVLLRRDPNTRRAVLVIWDPIQDLNADSKDIPCNDIITLKIRDGKLNMTVFNRSNDVIWGAYGANAVQFSMIQEYIAGMLNVEVGVYRQISDNMHIYLDNSQYDTLKNVHPSEYNGVYRNIDASPIMNESKNWMRDLMVFMDMAEPFNNKFFDTTYFSPQNRGIVKFHNDWFANTVYPMFRVWKNHKKNGNGTSYLKNIEAEDWRIAATQWMTKREEV